MHDCTHEGELQALGIYMDEIKDRLVRIEGKLDDAAKMTSTLDVLCNDLVHIQEHTQGLSEELKEMNERSIKSWRKAIGAIIVTVISAVVTTIIR